MLYIDNRCNGLGGNDDYDVLFVDSYRGTYVHFTANSSDPMSVVITRYIISRSKVLAADILFDCDVYGDPVPIAQDCNVTVGEFANEFTSQPQLYINVTNNALDEEHNDVAESDW